MGTATRDWIQAPGSPDLGPAAAGAHRQRDWLERGVVGSGRAPPNGRTDVEEACAGRKARIAPRLHRPPSAGEEREGAEAVIEVSVRLSDRLWHHRPARRQLRATAATRMRRRSAEHRRPGLASCPASIQLGHKPFQSCETCCAPVGMLGCSGGARGRDAMEKAGVMAQLRVLLVDDEELALERLQAMMASLSEVEIVGCAGDGETAASLVDQLSPDIVFTDIRMPRQGGMALAKTLQTRPGVEVVFVTAFDHFALEAFEVNAVDYLLKPVKPNRLAMAIEKAKRRRTLSPALSGSQRETAGVDGYWVEGRNGMTWLGVETITWVEAAKDYVMLHTAMGAHMMRATMLRLGAELGPKGFVRVSRSAYVRSTAVVDIRERGQAGIVVVLSDGTAIKGSGRHAAVAQAAWNAR